MHLIYEYGILIELVNAFFALPLDASIIIHVYHFVYKLLYTVHVIITKCVIKSVMNLIDSAWFWNFLYPPHKNHLFHKTACTYVLETTNFKVILLLLCHLVTLTCKDVLVLVEAYVGKYIIYLNYPLGE